MSRLRNRRGSLLLVIALVGMTVMIAVFAFAYLTQRDLRTSVGLAAELRATTIAESIAIQIEARVNAHPWPRRFWHPEPGIAFDESSSLVNLSGEDPGAGRFGFTVHVKDIRGAYPDYRIYVEVRLHGESYAFSWDKRYHQSLLGAMNHDGSRLGKDLVEIETQSGVNDALLESVKASAEAPPPDVMVAEDQAVLRDVREDQHLMLGAQKVPQELPAPATDTAQDLTVDEPAEEAVADP